MTYADRRCADADSHLMEDAGWLARFADSSVRDRLAAFSPEMDRAVDAGRARRPTNEISELSREELLHSKGWAAIGALDPEERTGVLGLLGFEQQVVFPTFSPTQFMGSKDDDVFYGGIDALNRGMAETCAADPRLLAVGLVSLRDPDRAQRALDTALDLGCRAIMIPTAAENDRAPSHLVHDPIWARLVEAGVPFVCHIGFGSGPLHRAWHHNGRPLPPDHIGGGENLRSRDYTGIHHNPERFLSCLVLDGVFERFPDLRGGVIELGASWVPGFLRNLDAAASQFGRFEPMLKELTLSPSDYIRRQVKFTPFAFEDIGWLIEQEGDELFLFSSDYPHPEGSRDPIAKFDASLDAHRIDDNARARFYADNFADVFGRVRAGTH